MSHFFATLTYVYSRAFALVIKLIIATYRNTRNPSF